MWAEVSYSGVFLVDRGGGVGWCVECQIKVKRMSVETKRDIVFKSNHYIYVTGVATGIDLSCHYD